MASADKQVAALEAVIAAQSKQISILEAQLVDSLSAGFGSDEERVYVASIRRKHFHRQWCKWAKYLTDRVLIEFGSHREAVEAGYKPCKTCKA